MQVLYAFAFVFTDVARHARRPLPIQLRSLCHSFHEVLSRRFPDEALDSLGTVLFLRFINPALGTSPASRPAPPRLAFCGLASRAAALPGTDLQRIVS